MCHKLAQFYGQAEAKKDAERIEKDFARAKERSAKQIAKAKAKNGDDVKVWFFSNSSAAQMVWAFCLIFGSRIQVVPHKAVAEFSKIRNL